MTLSFRSIPQCISFFAPGIAFLFAFHAVAPNALASDGALKVGVAEADITPPVGFPMAGYYHERLAEGEIDPLKARAIVFADGQTSGAIVVCDLIGISTDLKNEVRKACIREDRDSCRTYRDLRDSFAYRARLHEGACICESETNRSRKCEPPTSTS
jgi:hypothetical protein